MKVSISVVSRNSSIKTGIRDKLFAGGPSLQSSVSLRNKGVSGKCSVRSVEKRRQLLTKSALATRPEVETSVSICKPFCPLPLPTAPSPVVLLTP